MATQVDIFKAQERVIRTAWAWEDHPGHSNAQAELTAAVRDHKAQARHAGALGDDQGQPRQLVFKDDAPGDTSDGRHTFTELYEHRRALTALLCRILVGMRTLPCWRSRAHHPDDESPMFDGSFIVGMELPTGVVMYHYKIEFWDDFAGVPELEHSPKWDGSGPDVMLARMFEMVRRG